MSDGSEWHYPVSPGVRTGSGSSLPSLKLSSSLGLRALLFFSNWAFIELDLTGFYSYQTYTQEIWQ